jgi:hypothetical protein
MEVTVVSGQGKKEQVALDPTWSVPQLKKELHVRLPTLNIPAPEEQKLVCPFYSSGFFFDLITRRLLKNYVSRSFSYDLPILDQRMRTSPP